MKKYLALLSIAFSFVCNRAEAELVYAVTVFQELISFDSATPGSLLASPTAITGFTTPGGEALAGIDFRPATGQLYGLSNVPGSIYRLYTINPSTAVATQIGSDITTLSATFLGFDFNPVADRIRITTDADQNLRYNPDTGLIAATDGTIAYAAGDPNFGANPNIVGSAYSNNFAGAASTTLFNIDSTLDILTTQNPPNNGTQNTIGALGVNFSNTVGLDISPAGNAFATSGDPANFATDFYRINLTSGAATLVGQLPAGVLLRDIAVVPEPSSLGLVLIASVVLVSRRRSQRACIA
jgi:Domain of unknown function (DUF4394)